MRYATLERGNGIGKMGRIVAHVKVTNLLESERVLECDALVDTGAAYLALPRAWQPRLGKIHTIREIDCETATRETAVDLLGHRLVHVKKTDLK